MVKVKFTRAVFVPKVGYFATDQEYSCNEDYAKHLVENMKAAEYLVKHKSVAKKSN